MAPGPAIQANTVFAAKLIADIQNAVGKPYVFGGRDLSRQAGLDCAGFVMEAYHRQGITITRRQYATYDEGKWYTNAQMLRNGNELHTPITLVATPEPGDLVFFTRTYDTGGDVVSHVALYVSPGRMLGAQGNYAGYVEYGGSPYWQQHLISPNLYGRVQR